MSHEAWLGLNRILEEQEHKVPRAPGSYTETQSTTSA